MNKRIKNTLRIGKTVFSGLKEHNVLTHSAAIAFYTIFSLPGLLIIVAMIAGFFLGAEAVQGEISRQIGGIIGEKPAKTIENVLKTVEINDKLSIGAMIGAGTLLFSATTVFITMQDALNHIWSAKAEPKTGWLALIINRLISLGMIVSMGFILLVSLLIDTILELVIHKLVFVLGTKQTILLSIGSFIFTYLIVLILIGLVFKILPNVKLSFDDIKIGTIITATLFIFGKYLIGVYISHSDFSQTYEAAGSLILILIWVYYSTIIVLFGAEITRAIHIVKHDP